MRSNCFVFALRAWWRWRKHGAYFCVRLSRHIWGWHWLVFYRGRFIHFEPVAPQTLPWALLHKIFYVGTIKRGD